MKKFKICLFTERSNNEGISLFTERSNEPEPVPSSQP